MKPFYSMPANEVIQSLNSSRDGINEKEAAKRLEEYGKNELEDKKINKLILFLSQFKNIFIYILLGAAFITILSAKWIDFFVIIAIIFINSTISYFQELKASLSIEELKKLTESKATILRDGEKKTIPSSELVPGDIVLLSEGQKVTADIRLLETQSLFTDESSLTGESVQIIKDPAPISEDAEIYEQKNMAFSGTHVLRGEGKGIVASTGENTYFASIAKKTEQKTNDSPLIRAINHFTKIYSIYLVVLLFFIGMIAHFQARDLLEITYILLAELVSAVPEGLPIVITIVLVIGAKRLKDKQTLVRHLPATETLGSTTIIATDKTGTITEGKLTVEESYSTDEDQLKKIAALCNDEKDPIDKALKSWVNEFDQIRNETSISWRYPFDLKYRLMAVSDKKTLFVKGALDSLKELSNQNLSEMIKKEEEMAEKGLRVLAFAIGDFKETNVENWNLQIIGLIGFLDPIKEEVAKAVSESKKAHIRTIMITGDSAATAKKIAQNAGIYNEEYKEILTGKDVDRLNDDEFYEALKTTSVLARVLPEHKYRLVRILQEKKEVVSVTGDGVNDVPALRRADLGIAMGSGTDAAISVSDMVITHNNLNVIVEAVRLGRIISANIRKVIYYLISTSMLEIFIISLAIFLGFPIPLLPLHILWINIVTDGAQDKFFAFAKEENNVMEKKPKKPVNQFFQFSQILRILYFAVINGLLSFFMFRHLLNIYTYEIALTINFTSIVFLQWFNGIQAQKEKQPFFKQIKRSFTINPYIYLGVGIGLILQFFVIYGIPTFFHCVPLKKEHWIYPIGYSIIGFFLLEIRKWIEFFVQKK